MKYQILSFNFKTMNDDLMLKEIKKLVDDIILLWIINKRSFPQINPVEKDMKNQYFFSAYKFIIINNTFIESYDPAKYSLVFFGFDEFGNSTTVDFKKIDTITIDRFNKYIELLSSFIDLLKKNKEIIEKNNKLKIINNILDGAIKEIENERDK